MNMNSYICCSVAAGESAEVENLSELLSTIAEPNRLRVLCILQADGSHCVCDLNKHMPEVSQSLLSHHLADLREAGLVTSEKKGLKVYYSLTPRGAHITHTVLELTKKGEQHEHRSRGHRVPNL